MASFFRRLFRSAPKPAAAQIVAAARPTPAATAPAAKTMDPGKTDGQTAAEPRGAPSGKQRGGGKRSRTGYTTPLGLSSEARSGIALKTLTGA